ncbi:hypothetical protein NPIL_38261 [Nephila pilipes]|uniref:Uncharacterized protein n=1 Tax=Nephila pilipes TaxID=299642 RepID=A0A8X6P768_NEPPI|nr:hypothetical protein NPIL_446251 [Nephila pilipes]GFT54877.1 hypothetical protein NPIL_38261 [Nephila pilipes]
MNALFEECGSKRVTQSIANHWPFHSSTFQAAYELQNRIKANRNRLIFRYLHKNGRAAQGSRVPSNRIKDNRLSLLIRTDKAGHLVQVFLSKSSLVFQHVTEGCHVTKSPRRSDRVATVFPLELGLKRILCSIPSRVSFSLSSSQ